MAGFTNYFAQGTLQTLTQQGSFSRGATCAVALFTAVGNDGGTGFTEVSGGSYARVSASGATWNAPNAGPPSTISNASAITFPTSTASWGTVVAFGIFDNTTVGSGNLLAWDFLGNDPWYPFTAIVGSSSTATVTAIGLTSGSSPNLANGSTVVVDAEWGGSLPGGLTQYTTYTVSALASDVFCPGVATTTTGSGMVRQVASQVISNNVTFSFAAGALVIGCT